MSAKRLLPLLRIAVAAILIAWVVSRVSLGDAAERADGPGPPERLEGRIEGAWNAPAVAFRTEGGEERTLATAAGWVVKPGLLTLLRNLRGGLLAQAFVLFFLSTLTTVVRWQALLRPGGLEPGFGSAFRLTYVGLFFNNVVPGLTGGDVVKAVLAARATPKRAFAVVSVLVDRVIGLLSLAILAAAIVALRAGEFAGIAGYVYAFAGAGTAVGALFLSRRLRRATRLDRLLPRLPFGDRLRKVDEAILAYRTALPALGLAFALSLLNHGIILVGVLLVGRSLLDPLPAVHYFVLVPLINVISSIPIAPAGWGFGETLFGEFWRRYGAAFGSTFEMGVAVSVLYRLCQTGLSMLGGLLLLWKRELRMAARLAEEPAGPPGTEGGAPR